MKKSISVFVITVIVMMSSFVSAQNKVIVIPLGKSDPNLLPQNIKSGVTILGVTGTFPMCTPGKSAACYTGPDGTLNIGLCKTGQMLCGPEETFGACSADTVPVPEICDGLDNDCDGETDEDPCPIHYIFITMNSFQPNTGVAGADALCAAEVSGAHQYSNLSLTWKALVSTSMVDAKDRQVIEGPVYNTEYVYNSSASAVAYTGSDLWDGAVSNEILDRDGFQTPSSAWTGSTNSGTFSSLSENCNDWTDSTGSFLGFTGEARAGGAYPNLYWFNEMVSHPCMPDSRSVYCISSSTPDPW